MVMTYLSKLVNRSVITAAISAGALMLANFGALAMSPSEASSGSYVYEVRRNGEVIGQLRQDFERRDEKLTVVTMADVTVSILGLNIYEADQHVEETWLGNELQAVVSTADVDGDKRRVELKRRGDRLVGTYNGKDRNLSAKLVPTTLWNSNILKAKSVLDPSKGKLRKVEFVDRGEEELSLPSGKVKARHYVITGEFEREVWYDRNGVLVAVQMQAKDGSTIRQELLQHMSAMATP